MVGGGPGTTHDDLTAECLAEVLGVPLQEDADALTFVEERARAVAERRHLDFRDTFALARRQALLPAGSTAVPPAGVAPGIAARAGQTRIFAYPGVPYEFQQMWAETAAVLERDGFFPDVAVRVVRVFGVGELQVGPVLDALPHDRLELGINVGGGEVVVRIRYRRDAEAQRQADTLVGALEGAVPVYSTDGRTVDDMVAEQLSQPRAHARGRRILHGRTGRLPHHRAARQLRLLPGRRDQLQQPGQDGPAAGAARHAGAVRGGLRGGGRRDGRGGPRGAPRRLRALRHRRRSSEGGSARSPSASCTSAAPVRTRRGAQGLEPGPAKAWP